MELPRPPTVRQTPMRTLIGVCSGQLASHDGTCVSHDELRVDLCALEHHLLCLSWHRTICVDPHVSNELLVPSLAPPILLGLAEASLRTPPPLLVVPLVGLALLCHNLDRLPRLLAQRLSLLLLQPLLVEELLDADTRGLVQDDRLCALFPRNVFEKFEHDALSSCSKSMGRFRLS